MLIRLGQDATPFVSVPLEDPVLVLRAATSATRMASAHLSSAEDAWPATRQRHLVVAEVMSRLADALRDVARAQLGDVRG
jgi:hypothetical protein